MTDELKPCKCGETSCNGSVHVQMLYDVEKDEEKYQVMCESCDEETDGFGTEQEAIEAWNRRG